MMERKVTDPDLPPHPGKVLAKILDELRLSASAFAMELRVPTNRISMVLAGMRSISPDTALRLGHYLNGAPEYWMDLQRDYDLAQTNAKVGDKIVNEIKPRKAPPTADPPRSA